MFPRQSHMGDTADLVGSLDKSILQIRYLQYMYLCILYHYCKQQAGNHCLIWRGKRYFFAVIQIRPEHGQKVRLLVEIGHHWATVTIWEHLGLTLLYWWPRDDWCLCGSKNPNWGHIHILVEINTKAQVLFLSSPENQAHSGQNF
jgi:hypothetical protein